MPPTSINFETFKLKHLSSSQGKKASVVDNVEPMLFPPLVHTIVAWINLTTYYPSALYLDILGCGTCILVELFIPVVMSHCSSLLSFMMLSWLVVYYVSYGLPSFVM
jgi:hypothetical protein